MNCLCGPNQAGVGGAGQGAAGRVAVNGGKVVANGGLGASGVGGTDGTVLEIIGGTLGKGIVGATAEQVKSRIHQAREKLRKDLASGEDWKWTRGGGAHE